MLNSTVLDVAIGLVFMYLILGLMCTTVNEWLAQFFAMRAVTLKQGIHTLLQSQAAGNPRFTVGSLDIPKLVERLNTPGDKLGPALGLDPAITPRPEDVSHLQDAGRAMVDRLNSLLNMPDLFRRIDVSNVSPATLKKAEKLALNTPENTSKLASANYSLLTEAYPDEMGGLIRAFYNHPLIRTLAMPGKHPAYIPARTFAAALTDILSGSPTAEVRFQMLVAAIGDLPDVGVRRALTVIARESQGEAGKFSKGVEQWYDDAMDRVSGWYKRKTQIVTALVAAGITIFANADTVRVSRALFVNPTVRQKIVSAAAETNNARTESGLTSQERAEIGELTGWSAEFVTFNAMKAARAGKSDVANDAFPGLELVRSPGLLLGWMAAIVPAHLLGWFLTAVAVSLGAPFWFDTLNKFMNVRSAGTSPNEKGKDLSKA